MKPVLDSYTLEYASGVVRKESEYYADMARSETRIDRRSKWASVSMRLSWLADTLYNGAQKAKQ